MNIMPGPATPTMVGHSGLLSPVSSSNVPIKSILRINSSAKNRANLSSPSTDINQLKRKLNDRYDGIEDNDDLSEAEEEKQDGRPGSPLTKRQKTVHFDLSLNITTEVGKRTLEETKRSVRHALEMHAVGDDQEYIELQEAFSNDRDQYLGPIAGEEEDGVKPEELVLYVVALTSSTPMLNKSCATLVKNILSCSWFGRDDKFFRAYVQCTSSSNLSPVLQRISLILTAFSSRSVGQRSRCLFASCPRGRRTTTPMANRIFADQYQ